MPLWAARSFSLVCPSAIARPAPPTPYTIAIAQDIAEVPLYSGMGFRWVIFAVTEVIAILYVMAYARKVKKDPKKSVLYGSDLDGIQARSLMSCRPPR